LLSLVTGAKSTPTNGNLLAEIAKVPTGVKSFKIFTS
jgi:hypothetical protein